MPDETDRYVDAAAAAIGLPVADAYRAEVVQNVGLILRQGARLMSRPLDDLDEVASVFRP